MPKQFFVVPITHVDLAWKRGRDEMSEMLEVAVIRILDSLENDPDFKYHVEQAYHFRELNKRRPDLVARLKSFIQAGRVEVVGGMASTLENNLPNGECYVRNQHIGLLWVRDNWETEVQTGWLIDTFGINAQIPQLLRGFGLKHLMANRFGGTHNFDLFRSRGLDGNEIIIAGWGTYSAYMRREYVSEKFFHNWDDIELCFANADELSGPGPYMVIPYTENEMMISRRPQQLVVERNRERPDEEWQNATPRDFFGALEKAERVLPVVDGDLNPEFTGCFSLRHAIRLRNRVVENRLLEAEKWAALAGLATGTKSLEEAWWQTSYVQFHDVFTGSHPTVVFNDVMGVLDEIETTANDVLQQAFARIANTERVSSDSDRFSLVAFNGLPWERSDVLSVPLPPDFEGVTRVLDADGNECAFEVRDGRTQIAAVVPSVGFQGFTLEKGAAPQEKWQTVENATLENEWIRVDFDRISGLAGLQWKPTGEHLLKEAGSWLVLQYDGGNFQIENPNGAEVAASCGSLRLERLEPSPLGQTVRLSGEFPTLTWSGPDSFLHWSAEFFLPANRAEVRLKLSLDWKGEACRVRLTLPTTINTGAGIYEIPFGTVTRKPYTPRTNAKGEWPAHRFVAMENNGHGMALVNTGITGVEVNGGTLYTTVLRAPKSVYVGMEIDNTSSQHGHHEYDFSIVPYGGSWNEAGVAKFAQELNDPLLSTLQTSAAIEASASLLQLEPGHVVLSSVKSAVDDSGHLVVRVYETAGQGTEATLTVQGATRIWASDLKETPGEEIPVAGGQWSFAIKPFEIKTFLIARDG